MNTEAVSERAKSAAGLIPLAEAAGIAGCHISTLRAMIRRGELESMRGPHGAYHVSVWEVRALPLRPRGRPKREVSRTAAQELASWQGLFKTFPLSIYQRELEHAKRVATDPSLFPALYHLLSVHRLLGLGLTFRQIAHEVRISIRQARRLGARDLLWAIDRSMFTRLGGAERRRALRDAQIVNSALRHRLIAEGVRSHVPRFYSRSTPWPVKGPILVQPQPTRNNLARLRDAGLTEAEVEAVMLVGLTLDELNELMLRGARFNEADPIA